MPVNELLFVDIHCAMATDDRDEERLSFVDLTFVG